MKPATKAKARKKSGSLVNGGWKRGLAVEPNGGVADLFVLFGLLFRRRQAFEALQELFLGHAFDRNLGVVGIDAGAGRADQGHGIGLRFVDFDEFCSECTSSSRKSSGEMVESAISRSDTTGFLSLSRSIVSCEPDEIIRAR
jgi:hypothetical protein